MDYGYCQLRVRELQGLITEANYNIDKGNWYTLEEREALYTELDTYHHELTSLTEVRMSVIQEAIRLIYEAKLYTVNHIQHNIGSIFSYAEHKMISDAIRNKFDQDLIAELQEVYDASPMLQEYLLTAYENVKSWMIIDILSRTPSMERIASQLGIEKFSHNLFNMARQPKQEQVKFCDYCGAKQ